MLDEGVSYLALDTETTGTEVENGDRIVDVAVVEFRNGIVTGREWQSFVNPEREVSDEAAAVHGLTTEFLADKPLFADVVDDFLAFCEGHEIVIHNAGFDLGFLDAELERVGRGRFTGRFKVRDSLMEARAKLRGNASLDALCTRFGVDNSDRRLHGALKDARLLAEVYMKLTGTDGLAHAFRPGRSVAKPADQVAAAAAISRRPLGVVMPTPEEIAAHEAFIAKIKDPVWASLEGWRR